MAEKQINIDETTHERVPSTPERLTHALLSLFFGFLLLNIVAFWMFPGAGIGGFYLISTLHPLFEVIGELTSVVIYTFLGICGLFGWFRGKYFTDRLKTYISYWEFW